MKIAHVMVGVPCSGKSTFVKSQSLGKILSSDEIRFSLFGDLNNKEIYTPENHAAVFSLMSKRAIEYSFAEKDIVWDSTNLTRKGRYNLYQFLKNIGYLVVLHVFIEPLDKLISRSSLRTENAVSERIIKDMYLSFETPRYKKDHDSLQIHTTTPFFIEGSDIDEFVFTAQRQGILNALKLVNQEWRKELANISSSHDSPYHKEKIYEHIDMCLDNSTSFFLSIVSAFHDLGKSITKDGGKYYNHANVSSMYYLLAISDYIKYAEEKFPPFVLAEVILYHMNAHSGISDKMIKRHGFTVDELSMIEKFRIVDEKSRIVGE